MIYWLIFVAWIIIALIAKKGSQYHLWLGFGLFILAAILKTISLTSIAQPLMATALLGWLIGITMAIRDYKRS